MADPTHSQTRLWLRQGLNDGHGHIAPGCSHDWGSSLCGLTSSDLGTDEVATVPCEACFTAWRDGVSLGNSAIMLPRGSTFLMLPSGTLQRGARGNLIERRAQAITRDLRPLSPDAFGVLGTMLLSVEEDGTVHGDRWCSEYNENAARNLPVSMSAEDVTPHHDGQALHCHRSLPAPVEDAFFAALATCRARNGVLAVMDSSGWGLYENIRHEHGFHGTSDDHVCETGEFEVESSLDTAKRALDEMPNVLGTLVQENSRTEEVWRAVRRVMADWAGSQEALVELGREVLMLALATEESPASQPVRDDSDDPGRMFSSSIQAVVNYGISNGPFLGIINVTQARISLSDHGWTSPLRANRQVVEEDVIPRLSDAVPQGRENEVAADLADFMVTQDHVFQQVAEHYMQNVQDGIFLEVDADQVPPHWGLWPHGTDEKGRSLHWVPVPVAKVAPMDSMEASPAPFLPMTLVEAEALLARATGVQTR